MAKPPEQRDDAEVEGGAAEDDTEGHSLSLVMGLDALGRSGDRGRGSKPAEEQLTPLTKRFPRMKDDRRR